MMKQDANKGNGAGSGFGSFVAKKMLPVVAAVVVVMAALWYGIQYFGPQYTDLQAGQPVMAKQNVADHAQKAVDKPHTAADAHEDAAGHGPAADPAPAVEQAEDTHDQAVEADAHIAVEVKAAGEPGAGAHAAVESSAPASAGEDQGGHGVSSADAAAGHGAGDSHAEAASKTYPVVGMGFVDAVIQPMDYELNQRLFGWRPNDIVEYTDNVNNFQLGVLEVTRRTSRILAERLSRTGSSASFDPNLENAMNWFMIKADRYWFPSAESKYRDGLKELRAYYDKLERGEAQFYTRTDNLIPLLDAYQDLLGSCDENLVKTHEADGSPVSHFKADDYFYYTKGVAATLHTILKAIEAEFHIMVSREGGMEVLHHAIEMCHHATEIEPWLVLNSSPSSIFANHRAKMAAPISHARFYLGVLIKALST